MRSMKTNGSRDQNREARRRLAEDTIQRSRGYATPKSQLFEEKARAGEGMAIEARIMPMNSDQGLHELASRGITAAVLNFASAKRIGGGFTTGARAQEEDLCLCSNLFAGLSDPSAQQFYQLGRSKGWQGPDCALLTRDVTFFQNAQGEHTPPLLADVITCAAPNLSSGAGTPEEAALIIEQRMAIVLAAFEASKAEALLLGAWGCGVFRNDPTLVAAAMLKALGRGPAGRIASFAIPPGPNLDAFRRTLDRASGGRS